MRDEDRDAQEGPGKVRLDKWLWAARFFKTRSLAVDAIEAGKVQVNGERAKRAKLIQVGNEVRVRHGPYEHVVTVTGVSDRRGSATVAATLYTETPQSIAHRERLQQQMRDASGEWEKGKPTKRDRRELDRFKGKS